MGWSEGQAGRPAMVLSWLVLLLLPGCLSSEAASSTVSVGDSSSGRGLVQEGSLMDLLGLETLLGGEEEGVRVESTLKEEMAVQTVTSSSAAPAVEGSVLPPSTAVQGSTEGSGAGSGGTAATTLSPTLSTEQLLEEGSSQVQQPIVLSTGARGSEDRVTTTAPATSSSSASIVSANSGTTMASSTATPSLPRHHMTTTPAQELIITTTELDDDALALGVEEIAHKNLHLSDYDFRAKYPMTDYTIEASKPIVKMERTEPSYERENPNRMGLADGEIDPELDHFLSHEAPLKSGGPLNTTGRSKADNAVDRMDRISNGDLKKSDRRAEPGPDINDILSGLLNVVGEGLHFATNYVQENNKKKLKEKLDAEAAEEDENKSLVKSVNRTRVNNRGPPLGELSDQTFEAVPLLPPPGVKPGARPVAIPQRPFRLQGPRPKPTNTRQPPPFQSGVPLPERLVPGGETALPSQLPTRVGYTPNFTDPDADKKDNKEGVENQKQSAETNSGSTGIKKKVSVAVSAGPSLAPTAAVPPVRQTSSSSSSELPFQTGFRSSTPATPDLEASFPPPILVTPPSTPRAPGNRPLRRRPVTRPPWKSGERPPRPPGRPVRPKNTPPPRRPPSRPIRPQTSLATPPLRTAQRPLVFPSQSQSYRGGEPVIVTGVAIPADNDIIDLTVTAQQGFGGRKPKPKKKYPGFERIITKARPGDQFVSIDGARTYFDIGPTKAPAVPRPRPRATGQVIGATLQLGGQNVLSPTRPPYTRRPSAASPSRGYGPVVGSALPVERVEVNPRVDVKQPQPSTQRGAGQVRATTTSPRPGPTRRPRVPAVRIDTCIVGNDATCKQEHHEVCRTDLGVSSCYCKPGYGRKAHRGLCKKTIRLLMSMKIDRIQDNRIKWGQSYWDPNSEPYQVLEGEVDYAISSAMALTSFSGIYVGNEVNKFYQMNGAVTVNTTIEMEENPYTKSELVKRDIKKKLIQVIQARSNNIGSGNLYVAGPLNPIPGIEDFNECSEPEYNDCGDYSVCVNHFGGFSCSCLPGYGDRKAGNRLLAGRHCVSCPDEYCSTRGSCSIESGERLCSCTGNYYGSQCQLDGEVLAVAVGASVAAAIIIILTLICLCMWSRRWKREQSKAEMSRGAFPRSYMINTLPPPAYMQTAKMAPGWGPAGPTTAYQDPGLRWAHHLDPGAQNIYAQPLAYPGAVYATSGPEPLYMSPSEPPVSIYGTMPRGGPKLARVHRTDSPLSSHYATFRKEKLGPRVSLKLMQMMAEGREEDTRSILSLEQGQQGVSFNRMPIPARETLEDTETEQPETGSRMSLAVGGGRVGPLPQLPRPNTAMAAMGSRGDIYKANQTLIESSESEDTEVTMRGGRPRSSNSMLAGNLNFEDDFESEYLRYGGAVGVRNPRLVAQMRGAMPTERQKQQHFQMNMMNGRWQ